MPGERVVVAMLSPSLSLFLLLSKGPARAADCLLATKVSRLEQPFRCATLFFEGFDQIINLRNFLAHDFCINQKESIS